MGEGQDDGGSPQRVGGTQQGESRTAMKPVEDISSAEDHEGLQTDRETGQRYRSERQVRQTDRQTERQTDRQTYTHTQTDTHTNIHTHTHKHTHALATGHLLHKTNNMA